MMKCELDNLEYSFINIYKLPLSEGITHTHYLIIKRKLTQKQKGKPYWIEAWVKA